MFKKLLSNLPFNPGLMNQLSFYTKRLRAESALRRVGFGMVSLALLVQMFAVISPPQSSLLASPNNDLVNGGISSASDAATHCRNNTNHYGEILNHYSITCNDIATAGTVSLKSTDYNRKLYSMGRVAYGKAGETPQIIKGVTYYLRFLWAWDTNAASTYSALQGKTASGLTFFILKDCGNVVFIGVPPVTPPPTTPPPPPPPPVIPPQELSCTNLVMNVGDRAKVLPGDQLVVRGQASGKNIKPGQTVDMYYEYVEKASGKVIKTEQTRAIGFRGTTANDNQSHIFTAEESGDHVIRLTVKYNNLVASGSASGNCVKQVTVEKSCEASQTKEDKTSCIQYRKTASNTTQNLGDANGTTAQAGDEIVYHLFTTNTGKTTIKKYEVQENISDVLDYATLLDARGGTLDQNGDIKWAAADLKAGQTLQNDFTVRIKSPIPSTPISTSDPGHFDLTMTNVYGNVVTVKLPPSIIKAVEITTTKTLVNTGPGTSLIMGVGITIFVAYFFARSRLLARELDIVRLEIANTTGGL